MDLDKQKEAFLQLCRENIHREGLEKLLDWLMRADFFTAPASSKYHGAYEGGLCEHSLDVYTYAMRLLPLCEEKPLFAWEKRDITHEVMLESITIAALFHDLCKVNFYAQDFKNQKINGQWQQVPYYTIREKFAYGGHGSKSVFLIERFMRLTADEAVAINCHMGFAQGGDSVRQTGSAYEVCPLAWLIHAADEAATYLLDRSGDSTD